MDPEKYVSYLEEKIKQLKDKVESQEIIIDSLVESIKRRRKSGFEMCPLQAESISYGKGLVLNDEEKNGKGIIGEDQKQNNFQTFLPIGEIQRANVESVAQPEILPATVEEASKRLRKSPDPAKGLLVKEAPCETSQENPHKKDVSNVDVSRGERKKSPEEKHGSEVEVTRLQASQTQSKSKSKKTRSEKESASQEHTEHVKSSQIPEENTSQMPLIITVSKAVSEVFEKEAFCVRLPSIEEEIRALFSSKEERSEFRMNKTPGDFVRYCEKNYEYSVTNRKMFSPKNPQKLYIEQNLDRILKYILDNINALTLNQICSSLFLVNSSVPFQHKLVIAHDIVLEISDYTRFFFIVSSLFNNLKLEYQDAMTSALKQILYYQYCILTHENYEDKTLYLFETIVDNLDVAACVNQDIWTFTESLLEPLPQPFFSFARDRDDGENGSEYVSVSETGIRRGFALRALCHFLDWDFTYNDLIRAKLLPEIHNTQDQSHKAYLVYLLGNLAMNAFRVFGADESVENVFAELSGLMLGPSQSSCAAYLVLKQRYETECTTWLEIHSSALQREGFSVTWLESFLLV